MSAGENTATIEERVSYVEGRMDSLATKEDLADLKGELKDEMATLRGALKGEAASLRSELMGGMASLRGELMGEAASLRSELKGGMASLRGDIVAAIATAEVRITRWIVGSMIASVAVISAIAIAI